MILLTCVFFAVISLVSSSKLNVYEANVMESVLHAPVPTNSIERPYGIPEKIVVCHNYRTDFSKDTRGWVVENSMQDTYDIDTYGIKLNLMAPQ
jgi:hypothetical protein